VSKGGGGGGGKFAQNEKKGGRQGAKRHQKPPKRLRQVGLMSRKGGGGNQRAGLVKTECSGMKAVEKGNKTWVVWRRLKRKAGPNGFSETGQGVEGPSNEVKLWGVVGKKSIPKGGEWQDDHEERRGDWGGRWGRLRELEMCFGEGDDRAGMDEPKDPSH